MENEDCILPQMQNPGAVHIGAIRDNNGGRGEERDMPLGEWIAGVVERHENLNDGASKENTLGISCLPCHG